MILNAFCIFFGIESTSYSITVNNIIMSTVIPFSSSDTHKISITTTPKLDITSITSLTHTATNNNNTMQSSTGDIMLLIAGVISTVIILLVVSILVIIIMSVLMYKRRKRLTLKVSSGQDNFCHDYIDTSDMRKDEGEKGRMSKNPSYQPKGIYIKEHVIINIRHDSNIV